MTVELSELISLYVFTPSQRIVMLTRLVQVARVRGLATFAARVEAALARDERTLMLEYASEPARAGRHAPDAMELDRQLDRMVTAFDSRLAAPQAFHGPEHPEAVAGRALREELFPRGVAEVTRLPYAEQHHTLRLLLDRVEEGGDLREHVVRLGLEVQVDRLVTLTERYGRALDVHPEGSLPSREELRQARAEGQRTLLGLVAWIVGTFPGRSAEETEAREALLAPILEERERLRRRYLARARGGEELADEGGGEEASEEDDSAPEAGEPRRGSALADPSISVPREGDAA